MALLPYWLPTWPRMRMPNRAVLPVEGMPFGFAAGLQTESYPAETDAPAQEKRETGKADE